MRCKARSQAYAFDWPRWKRETVHVAIPVSSTIGTTTIPHAFSHCAKVRSSAMINRWISSMVFGIFSTFLGISRTNHCTLRDLDLLVECLLELVRAIEVVVLRFAAFRVTADTGWPPPVWQTTPLHFVLGASTRCRNG